MKKQNKWHKYALIISIIMTTEIFTFLMNLPVVEANTELRSTEGHLYLQNTSLAEVGPFELNGEWAFTWQELLTPGDADESSYMVNVPDVWANYSVNGMQLPKYGYATYRLTLHLAEMDVGRTVSLYMPSIATAYRLWVNKDLIASIGQVGETRKQMIPGNYPQVVTFEAEHPRIELLLQISNFHQRKSGIWEPITFGTVDQITKLREHNITFQVFVIGCIFIIGFYHLVLFMLRPREKAPLYLAIVCFGITLRTLLLKDTLLIYFFPQINWEVAVSLEYLSALIALLFFLLFIRLEFLSDIPKYMINLYVSIIIAYGIFVIVIPARIFTNTFAFFQLFFSLVMLSIVVVSITRIRRRRDGSILNFVAILVLFATIFNDIFYYSNWISTDEFVSVGLLFYLFTQAVHLARRSSRSFAKVEWLSVELQELNQSLEQMVTKRTEELQEANNSLQKIELARKRLLADVSHELNTPLTFIQGYIKAIIDGVVSKDDSTYLRTIYDDTQMMAHMIHDLQELSKLESGQVTFQFENVEIRTFLSQLSEEEMYILKKKGIRFQYKEEFNYSTSPSVTCLIDPIRIKQAYMNLIINAEKFTPEGGMISVEVQVPSLANAKEIRVNVTDTGAGIAKKDLPLIFERFYKVNHSGEGERRGVGLGLAIVKEIVEHHKGSLGVNSEQGQGSTFYFTLPIKQIKERESSNE